MKRHVLSHLTRASVWQLSGEHAASTPAQPASCMQPESHTPHACPCQHRVPTQSVDTHMTQHTAPSAEAAHLSCFVCTVDRRYVVAAYGSARGSLAVACPCRARAALSVSRSLRLRALCLSVSARPARAQTRCEESYYSRTTY